jgi:hypothetical protein
MEISIEYWNKLAAQTILISSLMSGFSITVMVSLIIYNSENKYANYTLKAAMVASGSFLVAIFSFTKMVMMTTPGFPIPFTPDDLLMPRLIGFFCLLSGIISLCVFLSFLGWIKSRKMGIFSTTIGVITFVLILLMMV